MQELTTIKFIVIGSSGVGKTSLVKRLTENTFYENIISTVGVSNETKTIEIDDELVKLSIWDTAGQERFRAISKSYFRNAKCVLLVFDITDRKSFDDVNGWINDVYSLCDPKVEIMLVGNKTDMIDRRVVSTADAEAYAKQKKIQYIEASALNGDNVKEAFIRTVSESYRRIKSDAVKQEALKLEENKNESKCCNSL